MKNREIDWEDNNENSFQEIWTETGKGRQTLHDWENQKVFGIGKEAPHVPRMSFDTVQDAVILPRESSPYYKFLNVLKHVMNIEKCFRMHLINYKKQEKIREVSRH